MSGKSFSKASDNAKPPGLACRANIANTKQSGNIRKKQNALNKIN